MSKNTIHEKMTAIEELEMTLTLFNSKRALSQKDKAVERISVGSSLLLIDRNGSSSGYYNRIKGFSASDLVHLPAILEHYDEIGVEPFFEMTPNNITEPVSRALNKEGFMCLEQLVYMELDPLARLQSESDVRIVKVTKENAEAFIRLVEASNPGMELTQEIIDRKKAYFYNPKFHNYIAYVGEAVAGIGSLFIDDTSGYIANDYTFEAMRGKGCQKALLAHRIHAALEMGIERLYTDVEFRSVSHNNMKKMGFDEVYTSSFWGK